MININATDVAAAVTEAAKTFSGTFLLPGGDGYDSARRVHNGYVDKRPAMIAQCIGAADIVDAIRLGRHRASAPRRRTRARGATSR